MQRLFAVVLAMACVLGSTPGFARGGGRAGGGVHMGDPTIILGPSAPTPPTFENRIPAPLPPPAQVPIINGPLSQPAFRGLNGIGQ